MPCARRGCQNSCRLLGYRMVGELPHSRLSYGDSMHSSLRQEPPGLEVDFDPEFAGDDDALRVQTRIFEQARWIAATEGLVSRGSRVGFLDAWRQSPQFAIDIAKKLDVAVFSLKLDQREQFTSRFREAGLGVSSFLHFSSQEAAFTRADSILADNRPARYELAEIRVDADTPRGIVAAAQRLMAVCGLHVTPGYFLRGLTQRNLSIVLVDKLDEPVGCAIAMDDSSAGPDFVGSYFVGSVGVAPAWTGKGLGRWLNARAIQIARSAGSASFVHQGVSAANLLSPHDRILRTCPGCRGCPCHDDNHGFPRSAALARPKVPSRRSHDPLGMTAHGTWRPYRDPNRPPQSSLTQAGFRPSG